MTMRTLDDKSEIDLLSCDCRLHTSLLLLIKIATGGCSVVVPIAEYEPHLFDVNRRHKARDDNIKGFTKTDVKQLGKEYFL